MSPRRLLHRIHKIAMGLIPVVIIAVAGAGAWRMIAKRPDPNRSNPVLPPPLVEVMDLSPTNYQTRVVGYGTVLAHRRVRLLPQVGGVVVEQDENLQVGGRISEGDTLIRIDPTDYETNLANAMAALAQAEFNLQLEEGQQVVAQREWDLLGSDDDLDRANRELALRVPHITEKRAALAGAQARVNQAQVDLERTVVRSPFDALVVSESAEIGQLVSPLSPVAELVCADEFRVQVNLPMDQVGRIRIPRGPGDRGARAVVYLDAGNGEPVTREGEVVSLLADLDERGRLARVHVSVKDPLEPGDGPRPPGESGLPLLLGSYVRVEIDGEQMDGAYLIPRTALRDESRVWIVDGDRRLQWKDVKILDRTPNFVVAKNGLESGTKLITSAMPLAVPGMEVRVLGTPDVVADGDGMDESLTATP